MPPINLFPLLEIYCSPARESCPHLMRDTGSCTPIDELQRWGLIETNPLETSRAERDYTPHGWTVTEKGRAFVEALTSLQLPEHRWVVRHEVSTDDGSLFEKVFGRGVRF